eukprot:CAMPEP_0184502262 /NCGR_PEP_ID=MMETSP0113_2-20130426/49826_1 /TAXON_ID=91329 /ORGANISM="Norrisiella sphaerica, Strain BC52" /LENGTH=324 /DNA_ID=CAMNT_0026891345 /DNA_START=107 /DNA_END=1081 /DNA_ORIENTATION=+
MAVGLRALLYPNSVIKTHVQTNIAAGSTKEVALGILSRNGIRGLWRGFFICQAGVIPAHSVYVTQLELSKQSIKRFAASQGVAGNQATQIGSFLGGAIASLSAQLVRTPTDVVAQRLMIQGTKGSATTYASGFHALTTILKVEGLRGLYAGLGAAILVSVPFSATFWGTYASLKYYIGHTVTGLAAAVENAQRIPSHAQAQPVGDFNSMSQGSSGSFRAPFGKWEALVFSSAAFLSATLAAAVTNPIDLVKTRIQTKAKTGRTAEGGRLAQTGAGIRQHLWSIVRYEGWWSLTKGFTSRVMTTGPFSIIGILVYEGTKHMSIKS